MSTNFPASADDSVTLPNPSGSNSQNNPDHASLHANANDAIKAVEAKLGTGASTPANNTFLIGNGAGASAYSALTSAQLAARLSDETGSGAAVFGTSPTLITPSVDTINESTPANGVTIDGLNVKDSKLNTNNSVVTANVTDSAITPAKLLAGTGSSWTWQDYTPTYANITVGNGTVVARYIEIGKTVHVRYSLTCGATTALGNAITISLPIAAHANYSAGVVVVGTASGLDNGTANYGGWAQMIASTTVVAIRWNDGNAALSSTFPFTEAATDVLSINISYEAA